MHYGSVLLKGADEPKRGDVEGVCRGGGGGGGGVQIRAQKNIWRRFPVKGSKEMKHQAAEVGI